jgi:hypothetical protein
MSLCAWRSSLPPQLESREQAPHPTHSTTSLKVQHGNRTAIPHSNMGNAEYAEMWLGGG